MSSFKFNGKNVFYTIDGQGSPIIILNGIMMSTKSWQPFIRSLSAQNRVIRVDFFDQGQTDKLVGMYYDHDIQVDLVKALMDHLLLDKVSIVGISYGGEVALEFAIKYPSNVDRLVLFNTAAYTNPWLKDIGRGWIEASKTGNPIQYYLTAIPVIYSPQYYESKLDWMKKREKTLMSVFSNKEFLDAMERLTLSSEPFDVRDQLSKITAKTLIVTAENDYLTPIDNQEYLYKHIPGAEWIKIPNAGHASMYEKPLLFTSIVLGFVNVAETEYTV
jgi:pimeloyl-ACP methyl ester carboxylesterase